MESRLLQLPKSQKVRQAPKLFALLGLAAFASVGSGMPAQAIGFLDLNSGNWSGASVCAVPSVSFNCIEDLSASSVTLVSDEGPDSDLFYTSNPVPIGYSSISFVYSFDQLGTQSAFYQVGNETFSLGGTGGFASPITISSTLDAGEIFRFGILTNDTTDVGILSISNFTAIPLNSTSAVPVPAPLPLLGAGAAFGWIRRRRAQLRGRLLPAAAHQ